VVARIARDPTTTPAQAWRGLNPVEAYTGLLLARVAHADTHLYTWQAVVEMHAEQGAAADRATVEQARAGLDGVAANLAAAFLDRAGEGADVAELRARHAHSSDLLDELRAALARIPGAGRDGAAIRGNFLPGEEAILRSVLRQALRRGIATPQDPAELPASPRGPPARVVVVPGVFLRLHGLSRVVDHLGAYTLHTDGGAVVVFTDEMLVRLRAAGLAAEILAIEIDDRVLGRRDEDTHQRHVDAVMGRLSRP